MRDILLDHLAEASLYHNANDDIKFSSGKSGKATYSIQLAILHHSKVWLKTKKCPTVSEITISQKQKWILPVPIFGRT